MSDKHTVSDLSLVQLEHHEVARGFVGMFSRKEFKQQYEKRFPYRNPNSILPSDFSCNNKQKHREKYPSFLLTIAPSCYMFVGLDYEYNDASDIRDKIDQLRKQGVSNQGEIKSKMIELSQNIISRVAVANGQSVKSVVKNKELFGFDSVQALTEFLDMLWAKQKGICNLTGLPMQLRADKGTPNHMIVSVDRIDSDRHYSPDNLQLTCWFANRWKGTTPNGEFIDLLNRIREGPHEGDA